MVDLMQVLPFEMVVKLFSLLSTPDIAISSATCRSWRRIASDPHINQVIDLTDPFLSLDRQEVIDLLLRLAFTTTDPSKEIAKEVRLDVSCFWEGFKSYMKSDESEVMGIGFENLMKATNWEWLKLITVLSSGTKGQLSKVSFNSYGETDGERGEEYLGDVMMETARILKSGKSDSLREIRFSIPFPISLESRANDKSKASFFLQGSCPSAGGYDIDDCSRFLGEIVAFTGSGLTKLDLHLGLLEGNDTDTSVEALYEQLLNDSKETLEDLDLRFNGFPPDVFHFAAKLKNLSTLTLESEEENLEFCLQAPEIPPSFQLRNFTFRTSVCRINHMAWLEDWVGSKLESFSLLLPPQPLSSQISTKILSSTFKSNFSLKRLNLENIAIQIDAAFTSFESLLPNLESLSLVNLNTSGYQIFSTCSMSRLQVLDFESSHSKGFIKEEENSSVTTHLLAILGLCASTLEHLEVRGELHLENGGEEKAKTHNSRSYQVLTFPRLQKLKISSRSKAAIEMIRNFNISKLRSLAIDNSPATPRCISSLLNSSSECLESVKMYHVKADLSETATEFPKIMQLSRLKKLELWSVDDGILNLFHGTSIKTLTWLELLGRSSPSGPQSFKSLIPLLTSNAPTLEIIRVEKLQVNSQSYQASPKEPVIFSNAVLLSMQSLSSIAVHFLFTAAYPKIKSIQLRWIQSPSNQIQKFVHTHSSKLETLDLVQVRSIKEVKNHSNVINDRISFPKLIKLVFAGRGEGELNLLISLVGLDPMESELLETPQRIFLVRKRLTEIAPRSKLKYWP